MPQPICRWSQFRAWLSRGYYWGLVVAIALLWPFSPTFAAEAIAPTATTPQYAEATILGTTPDSLLQGDVRFIPQADGLEIQAGVIGLPPGQHGFHIHEVGNCAEAGDAAGGHFNPDRVRHGKLLTDGLTKAHAGDLGNLLVTAIGVGALDITVPGLTLTEGPYAIANRAIVIHAEPDDYGQPTGHAGARVGCGVIELVNPTE